ncbi:MAG: hypothetical protein ACLTR6_08310 [Clostridium fessum]
MRESGDEFIQNIPVYVEEIGRWWADVVQFAAKYNIVLPEYVIDSDLLIEKATALISDEKSGILTVTWGAANLCPVGFCGCSLGACLCTLSACEEGGRRGTFEKTHCDSPSAKDGAAAS